MKVKKALKISTYCLLVSGIIALGLCYIIIPDRTKGAIDIVIEYLNRPMGVAFGTTITLGVVFYFVLKIILLARKSSVAKESQEFIGFLSKKELELKSMEEKVYTKDSEIKVLLSNYSQRIDNLTELIVKVCETMPNAKIKAIAQEIKASENELKETLSKEEDLIEKYSDKEITDLFEKIELLEKVVKTYGERKETTND